MAIKMEDSTVFIFQTISEEKGEHRSISENSPLSMLEFQFVV
jgi:hypothetical protein